MLRSLCLAASTISSTESPHQRSLLELRNPLTRAITEDAVQPLLCCQRDFQY